MSSPATPPSTHQLELKDYSEDQNFTALGNPEPNWRSQIVIYKLQDKKWWIKITVKNPITFFACNTRRRHVKSKRERRVEFQTFVTSINFQLLAQEFFDDTVTEIVVNESPKTADSDFLPIVPKAGTHKSLIEEITYLIQEDPLRVRYPSYRDYPSFQAIDLCELIQEVEISNGVCRVLHKGTTPYILKVVNCPFYCPRDTRVIERELRNLELFRGVEGIVQSAGVAVIPNPHASTQQSSREMVIMGILFEYYSGGTLDWLLRQDFATDTSWEQWAIQIGDALDTMHRAGRTHMDLKPSNIVLDKNANVVIIDISCVGGVTREYQAPETLNEISPLNLPFEARELHDNWAYGKILQEIALKIEDDTIRETLTNVGDGLTQDVSSRWDLTDSVMYQRFARYKREGD